VGGGGGGEDEEGEGLGEGWVRRGRGVGLKGLAVSELLGRGLRFTPIRAWITVKKPAGSVA
jgi:hypothetical protein